MLNAPENDTDNKLKNFNNKAKKAIKEEITSILKSNPVEEIITFSTPAKIPFCTV